MQAFPRIQERFSEADHRAVTREIVSRFRWDTITWNAPECAANTTTDTTITSATEEKLGGMRTGMIVHVTPPSTFEAGLVIGGAWCAADDSITIRIGNLTAAPINPASGDYVIFAEVV